MLFLRIEEKELIKSCINGNKHSFEKLINQIQSLILNLGHVSKLVMQEFLQMVLRTEEILETIIPTMIMEI